MLPFNCWLCRFYSRHERREWFGTVHLHIARLSALFLLGMGEVQEHEQTRNHQKQPNPIDQNIWLRHTAPPEILESDLGEESHNVCRRSLLRYRPCWAAIRETGLKVAKALWYASAFGLAANSQAQVSAIGFSP